MFVANERALKARRKNFVTNATFSSSLNMLPLALQPGGDRQQNISEISSTASPEENRKAFCSKLHSRKYKFILNILIATFSFLAALWFAILTRAAITFLEHIEVDFRSMTGKVEHMASQSSNLIAASSGLVPRVMTDDEIKLSNATTSTPTTTSSAWEDNDAYAVENINASGTWW